MAIYQPYFYIIQDIENLKYYAGCKYSKDADPTLLLVENGYHTSSGTIKKLIAENGLLRFAIKKIRVFSTGDQAYEYETRFLKKVNARCNDRFYNSHNNDGVLPSYGTEKYKNLMRQKYGDDANHKIPSIREKTRQTVFERYGVNTPLESAEIRAKTQETVLRKYGVKNAWQRPENQAKIDMKKRGESISKTKSDPHWKETVGKAAIQKQLQSVDQITKGINVSVTKSDPEWKSTVGQSARDKMKKTLNDPAYRALNDKTCPHCGWTGYRSTYNRWHGNNCRQKSLESRGD